MRTTELQRRRWVANKAKSRSRYSRYVRAFDQAMGLMLEFPDLGYYSALKGAADEQGIAYGQEMEAFIRWADRHMEAVLGKVGA